MHSCMSLLWRLVLLKWLTPAREAELLLVQDPVNVCHNHRRTPGRRDAGLAKSPALAGRLHGQEL